MNTMEIKRPGIEAAFLIAMTLALIVSIWLVAGTVAEKKDRLKDNARLNARNPAQAVPADFRVLDESVQGMEQPGFSEQRLDGLLNGELRVVAIGSAYPIPYDAEICPFSEIPQPAMNQLDRDGDGIADTWEVTYGLNKYDAADALLDLDADGFINREEFIAGTLPDQADSHPPYAQKIRFIERKEIPFPYIFQGITELSDGRVVFQINSSEDGKSHFLSIGEEVEGIIVERFIPEKEGSPARLYVRRGDSEIELVRGRITADPESKAELINILDRSREIVTMGELLSLRGNTYTVLSVLSDKVILKDIRTEEIFEITGLAEGN